MITHNPEAASYGDRIIHMRDGEIVAPEQDPMDGTSMRKRAKRVIIAWQNREASHGRAQDDNL
jgi:ABC-type lipoprotein export system ATPase subunit